MSKKQDKTMNKQFRTYNEYKKYMVEQGDVESDVIEKFIGMGLLMKVKVVSVEGYEVIGFRLMDEQEFTGSRWKKNGVFQRVMKWLKGDK